MRLLPYIVSSIDFCPNGNTPDVYSCQKGCCIFRISCCYSTPAFQFQKCILHKMPKPIQISVVLPLLLPVPARRNNWGNTFFCKLLQKTVTVIALVSQQILSLYSFNKFAGLGTVCNITCCNKHSDWHTMCIYCQMELAVEPPFVRAIS